VQVDEALNQIGRPLGLKTCVLIGGENMGKQIQQLRRNPHIIIVTPGRLVDHLEQKTVRLNEVNILILDEADRMLDMGFAPQIKKILQNVPTNRQTMLFSATMPQEIIQVANSYMKLTQELFFVHRDSKMPLLENILKEYKGSVLIFSRTKFGAKRIAANLRRAGQNAAEIHSNRSLNQRLEALSGFRLGKYRVLVATDIAARGIDVTGIELVINYDLPQQASDYIHRIGRTGRAEHTGHAISFATPEQKSDVRAIERLIKKQLPISELPALAVRQKFIPQPDAGQFQRAVQPVSSSSSFLGYRTANRVAQESFGHRGRFRPSLSSPKALRNSFSRRSKPSRFRRAEGKQGNYHRNTF
jgi:ATP-dependent RNA helicase RhlE